MNHDKQTTPQTDPLSTLDKFNLAFGIIAILLLAGSLIISYLPPTMKMPETLAPNLRTAGMAAMALYAVTLAVLKEKDIAAFFKMKHTASGANIAVQILGMIAILAAINWYGTRHHVRYDVTENKQYSLSEQTKKILDNLKEPVTVTLYGKTSDSYTENLRNLWKEYTFHGGDKVKFTYLDVDREPAVARKAGVTAYGTSILERGTRKTTITGSQEQDLTSALLKVTQDGQKVIYFLTGHGELAMDKFDRDGISSAKDALEKQNYKLDKLTLFNDPKVPSDAALVVVPGPSKPLAQKELDALDEYIGRGGRVFLSLIPTVDAKVDTLAKKYGIVVHDDLVLEPNMRNNVQGNLAAPVVQKFPYHTITQGLQVAYFLSSRSLAKVEPAPTGINISPLVETSSDAWGETNLLSRPPTFEAGKDNKGPLQLMMVAEKGKGRLIVAGNTTFLSNSAFLDLNNGDLFLNSLNWMADEENLVSIPPKDSAPKSINLVPAQYYTIFFGTVLGFPLALLLAAGFVWWRRR